MTFATKQTLSPTRPSTGQTRYTEEVVYVYAYDVAYEMHREVVIELLNEKIEPFTFDANKRSPRHLFFYKPHMARLPPVKRIRPHDNVEIQHVVKLLPVGAISITMRIPFAVDRIENLIIYHDLQFGTVALTDEMRQLAESVRHELERFYIRPMPQLMDEKAYTVFCLEAPLTTNEGVPLSAENWLQTHRRQMASLLTQESDIGKLSQQEAEESTVRYLNYYQNDLAVIDWDAALLVDEKDDFEETLYIIELANLQLAELETYDRILDHALERSYHDLGQRGTRSHAHMLRELKEIRIDLARFNDELSNITKFFGDWHLTRLYKNIATRFHLADWHRTIDEKLKTLNGLYQILKHDQTNRLMLWLEMTIMLLFIIDLVILFLGLKSH